MGRRVERSTTGCGVATSGGSIIWGRDTETEVHAFSRVSRRRDMVVGCPEPCPVHAATRWEACYIACHEHESTEARTWRTVASFARYGLSLQVRIGYSVWMLARRMISLSSIQAELSRAKRTLLMLRHSTANQNLDVLCGRHEFRVETWHSKLRD